MKIHNRTLLSKTIAIVAIVSSIITIFSFIAVDTPSVISENPVASLLIIYSLCISLAVLLSLEPTNISIKVNNNTQVNVKVGDLGQHKNIVIPVNDYFDTQVDDFVVSPDSIHGKFIRHEFGGNVAKLEELIDKGLNGIEFEVNDHRELARNKRYPLGTTVRVNYKDRDFYLVALTRFDDKHKASIKSSEYQRVISLLIDFISTHSQGKKVSMPLVGGSARSGIKELTKQKKLELIILTMMLSDNLSLENGIDLVISKSDLEQISLNQIKYHMIT